MTLLPLKMDLRMMSCGSRGGEGPLTRKALVKVTLQDTIDLMHILVKPIVSSIQESTVLEQTWKHDKLKWT